MKCNGVLDFLYKINFLENTDALSKLLIQNKKY